MHFTEEEREKIKAAVQHVESKTAGEVVPFITKQSDDYNEASWLLVILFGFFPMLSLTALKLIDYPISTLYILVPSFILAVLAWFAPRFIPAVLRIAISKELFEYRAYQKAQEAFLQEQVFQTADRIGILIFISELERKVIVLADKGINGVVKDNTWSSMVEVIVSGIKNDNKAQGIIDAIYRCEKILLDHGFENRVKDANELGDEIREN